MKFIKIASSYYKAFFSVATADNDIDEATFSETYKSKLDYAIALSWNISRLLRGSRVDMINSYHTYFSFFWLSCYGLFVDAKYFSDKYSGWVQFPVEEAYFFVRDGKFIPQTYGVGDCLDVWIRGDCQQATPVFILQTIIDYLHLNFETLIHKLHTDTQVSMQSLGIPYVGHLILVKQPRASVHKA